jgi:hypothetical protein
MNPVQCRRLSSTHIARHWPAPLRRKSAPRSLRWRMPAERPRCLRPGVSRSPGQRRRWTRFQRAGSRRSLRGWPAPGSWVRAVAAPLPLWAQGRISLRPAPAQLWPFRSSCRTLRRRHSRRHSLCSILLASSWQLLVRVEKDPFDESAHKRTVLLYGIILLEAVVEVGVKPLCH